MLSELRLSILGKHVADSTAASLILDTYLGNRSAGSGKDSEENVAIMPSAPDYHRSKPWPQNSFLQCGTHLFTSSVSLQWKQPKQNFVQQPSVHK